MAGKARETGLDDTRNPAQAADWLERLRASANADAALVHRGRFVDAVVLFDTGASQHLLDIRRGRIEALAHGPFVMPRWDLAQPFRTLAHNGEINTLWGNRNGMAMRGSLLEAPAFGELAERVRDPIRPRGSDSASLDNALELLVRAGRSPVHAAMMLVPAHGPALGQYPARVS